jgi:hypothetical protein
MHKWSGCDKKELKTLFCILLTWKVKSFEHYKTFMSKNTAVKGNVSVVSYWFLWIESTCLLVFLNYSINMEELHFFTFFQVQTSNRKKRSIDFLTVPYGSSYCNSVNNNIKFYFTLYSFGEPLLSSSVKMCTHIYYIWKSRVKAQLKMEWAVEHYSIIVHRLKG